MKYQATNWFLLWYPRICSKKNNSHKEQADKFLNISAKRSDKCERESTLCVSGVTCKQAAAQGCQSDGARRFVLILQIISS